MCSSGDEADGLAEEIEPAHLARLMYGHFMLTESRVLASSRVSSAANPLEIKKLLTAVVLSTVPRVVRKSFQYINHRIDHILLYSCSGFNWIPSICSFSPCVVEW